VPIILSTFTHLWNPVGFPSIDYDEAVYIRRAMHFLDGKGVQEVYNSFQLYDHPYFGQLFLAAALSIVNYPNSINPSVSTHSIEMLYLLPRVLMGILAVVDTFLVYKIADTRYNRKVAFVSATIFAVMPSTWLLRGVFLESIQLPLLLSSILFALYCRNHTHITLTANYKISINKNILVILSGIFLGLSIFTKIPAFTFIPLVGFLIIENNNRRWKAFGIWFIPVILISAIWPAYSIYAEQLSSWLYGVYYQTHRESNPLYQTVYYFFLEVDPIIVILGVIGFVYAAIRRDLLILLWVVPFVLLLHLLGYVGDLFNLIPLIPVSCIGGALIIYYLSCKLSKKTQTVFYSMIVSGIAVFGLVDNTLLLTQNVNPVKFQAAAFLSQYLTWNSNDNITIISNPLYLWIPQYVFHITDVNYVPYDGMTFIKGDNVLLINDTKLSYDVKYNQKLQKVSDLVNDNRSNTTKFGNPQKDTVTIRYSNITDSLISKTNSVNLIDKNHKWEPFNNTSITQNNNMLHISVNNDNANKSGASLMTKIDMSKNPLLLLMEYRSSYSKGMPTFKLEVTEFDKNETRPLQDLRETYYAEIKKDMKNTISWNYTLDNAHGNLTRTTFIFPILNSFGEMNSKLLDNSIELRLSIIPNGKGENEIAVTKMRII
jgi:hypothetical protein